LLDGAKLTAIAAKDPSDPDAFVAAMYFLREPVLIVAAKYTPAVLLNREVAKKDYQEILHRPEQCVGGEHAGLPRRPGADGLESDHDEGAGSIPRRAASARFSTRWKKDQKLTDDQYAEALRRRRRRLLAAAQA